MNTIQEKQKTAIQMYYAGKREELIENMRDALDELQDGVKITNKRIGDFIGKSERTIKRRMTPKMIKAKEIYNKSLIKTIDH